MRVGITGQAGFIGTHLARYVTERTDTELVPFEDSFFGDSAKLRTFVRQCDIIVHLAAASRMPSEGQLYELNVGLVQQVIDAMEAEQVKPLVMFSSSTHEARETAYGRAKREGRARFEAWAQRNGASFVGFIFPNIFGPGARVHYASFIANFAWELQHGEEPKILVDAPIRLKYIRNHCRFIGEYFTFQGITKVDVPWDFEKKVSDILGLFSRFAAGEKPSENLNEQNLYDTFTSYK